MKTRVIIQEEEIYSKAQAEKALPAGWYSNAQIGAHEETEHRQVFLGNKTKPKEDFVYWEPRRVLTPKLILGSNP